MCRSADYELHEGGKARKKKQRPAGCDILENPSTDVKMIVIIDYCLAFFSLQRINRVSLVLHFGSNQSVFNQPFT
jgi:hypothetical protein